MNTSLARMRLAQVRPLVAPLRRAVVWSPVVLVGLIGLVVLEVSLRTTDDAGALLARLRLCGVGLAAALAFVVDDDAALTLAPSPTALLARRAQRILAGVALAAASWLLMAVRVGVFDPGRSWRVAGGLALETATYLVVALAAASLATRVAPDGFGGATGAMVVFVLYLGSVLVPPRYAPLPANPFARGATTRLAWDLALTFALLVWASQDPARRRPGRH
jgi:hypothetical protein